MRLKDNVAIVTGAARGLGKAFSVAMAKEGAKIMATDLIALGDVVREVQALGGEAKALQADVTVEAEIQKQLDTARHGTPDPVTGQRTPKKYQEHAREYFEKFKE